MPFNELNSVEYFIIQQLSWVNLNSSILAEPSIQYDVKWQYLPASIRFNQSDILKIFECFALFIIVLCFKIYLLCHKSEKIILRN